MLRKEPDGTLARMSCSLQMRTSTFSRSPAACQNDLCTCGEQGELQAWNWLSKQVPLLPSYSRRWTALKTLIVVPEIVDSSMRQELLRVVEKVIVFLFKVHGSEGLFRWSEYNFTGADDAANFIRQVSTWH